MQCGEGAGGETSGPGPRIELLTSVPPPLWALLLSSGGASGGLPGTLGKTHRVTGACTAVPGARYCSSQVSLTPGSWCPAHCPGEEPGSGAKCLWEGHSGGEGPTGSRLGGPFPWCYSPGSHEPPDWEPWPRSQELPATIRLPSPSLGGSTEPVTWEGASRGRSAC